MELISKSEIRKLLPQYLSTIIVVFHGVFHKTEAIHIIDIGLSIST